MRQAAIFAWKKKINKTGCADHACAQRLPGNAHLNGPAAVSQDDTPTLLHDTPTSQHYAASIIFSLP